MRAILVLASLIAVVLIPAAGARAEGCWLSWYESVAGGGEPFAAFACDTNAGFHTLVLTFEVPDTVSAWTDLEFDLVLTAAAGRLPDWWQICGDTPCRNGLSMRFDFKNPPYESGLALDPYPGQDSAEPWEPTCQLTDAPELRVMTGFTNRVPISLSPGKVYYAVEIRIDHARTAGEDACAGCAQPICVKPSRVLLYRDGIPDLRLSNLRGVGWQPDHGCFTW